MKKGVNNSKSYNNRLLYSLIVVGVLIFASVGVYAASFVLPTDGTAPNPGHNINEVSPPASCGTNNFLEWTGSANANGGWSCSTVSLSSYYLKNNSFGYYNSTHPQPVAASPWTTSGSNIYYNTGDVGIGTGTTAPGAPLQIKSTNGNIWFGGSYDMRFDGGTDNVFDFTNTASTGIINFYLGSSNILAIKSDGIHAVGIFYQSSDKNLKTNIQPLNGYQALQNLENLQGVSFNWKSNGNPDMGLIAQDVQKVYPDLVTNEGVNGTLDLNYIGLIAPMIESIKAQQSEIAGLQDQINQLNLELSNLKSK